MAQGREQGPLVILQLLSQHQPGRELDPGCTSWPNAHTPLQGSGSDQQPRESQAASALWEAGGLWETPS